MLSMDKPRRRLSRSDSAEQRTIVRLPSWSIGSHVPPSRKPEMTPWTSLRCALAPVLTVAAIAVALPERAWRAEAAAEPARPLFSCPACSDLACVAPIRPVAPNRTWCGARSVLFPRSRRFVCSPGQPIKPQSLAGLAPNRLPRPVHAAGLCTGGGPPGAPRIPRRAQLFCFRLRLRRSVLITPQRWRRSFARRYRTRGNSSTFSPTAWAGACPACMSPN